jgi:eukaryotic-like serine/threonine-protein kinase
MLAHLGPYRLEAAIGSGGMGAVFRALDERNGQAVAIKRLASTLSDTPALRERMLREARLAGSLKHPGICAVLDAGVEADGPWVAMPLLEGETLAQRLRREALPLAEALRIAIQLCEALQEAHRHNILHRDIKPSNVFLCTSGQTMLLDFGLARLSAERQHAELSSAISTLRTTTTDSVAGTAAYMSPEQALGEELDVRSDIFSIGLVLYEMLARRSPFPGATMAAVFNAILNKPPEPLGRFAPDAPQLLAETIGVCLARDKQRRFSGVDELLVELRSIQTLVSSGATWRRASEGHGLPVSWAAFGGVTAALLLFSFALMWRDWQEHHQPFEPRGAVQRQLSGNDLNALEPALTRDGRRAVWVETTGGRGQLVLYDFTTQTRTPLLPGAEHSDRQPAWSPDARRIAFRSTRDGGGIFVLDLLTQAVKKMSVDGHNPAWSPDGEELALASEGVARPEDRYTSSSDLVALRVDDGARRKLVRGDGVQPVWSPNGQRIAFWSVRNGQRDIYTVRANSRSGQPAEPIALTNDVAIDWNPAWSPDGRWIYFASDRGGTMQLWRIGVDPDTGEATSEPVRVQGFAGDLQHFAIAGNGRRMIYSRFESTAQLMRLNLDAPQHAPVPLTKPSGVATRPAASPDGRWIAFTWVGMRDDIYLLPTEGGEPHALLRDEFQDRGPVFSPRGDWLAFFTNRSGAWEVWRHDLKTGENQALTRAQAGTAAWPVFSPDGGRLLFTLPGRGSFLMDLMRSWQEQAPIALPPYPEAGLSFAAWSWSPDGARIAGFLQSGEGSFRGLAVFEIAERRFQRLTAQGSDPVWMQDSRSLLFVDGGCLQQVSWPGKRTQKVYCPADGEVARRGFAVLPQDRAVVFSLQRSSSVVGTAERADR